MDKTVVKKNRRIPTKKLVYTALMTALIAVLSQVSFPLPSGVPVTLQTFAVAFSGYFCGIWGAVALLIYLALGAVGVPVFSSFKGGFSALIGLTGGFLVGFIPFVLACSIRIKTKNEISNGILRVIFGLIGLIICHLFGAWWFGYQSGNGFTKSLLLVSVPYIAKDVISVVGAYLFNVLLKKRTKLGFEN